MELATKKVLVYIKQKQLLCKHIQRGNNMCYSAKLLTQCHINLILKWLDTCILSIPLCFMNHLTLVIIS